MFKKNNFTSNDNTNNLKDSEIIEISVFFSNDKVFKNKKRKLNLPPISNEEFYSSRNYNEEDQFQKPNLKINSCFVPENYKEYSKSCNKYQYKIDPFLKEKLSPKNILIKNRQYDNYERNLISDFKRDEMLQRAAGQGIFLRFQSYNKLKNKRPLKIHINQNNNDRYIKKPNIENKRYNLNENNKTKNIMKYYSNSRNIFEGKTHHKTYSFNKKEIEKKPIDIKIKFQSNRMKDQKIISALKKSGDENLRFYIGLSHIFY